MRLDHGILDDQNQAAFRLTETTKTSVSWNNKEPPPEQGKNIR